MTITQDAKKYLNEKPSAFMTKDRRLKRSAVLIEGLVKEIERRDEAFKETERLISDQSEDEGLWFDAETSPEAYLQHHLRELHRVAEEALSQLENSK